MRRPTAAVNAVLGVQEMRPVFLGFACLLSTGCASEVTTTRKAGILTIAVAGDVVFIGRARTFGTDGTFRMSSLESDPIECTGRFRYLGLPNGTARFSCSNNDKGTVRIQSEGYLIGTGSGTSSLGPVQIAFGYSVREVNNRLKLPDGKVLRVHNQGILLE